MNYKVIWLSIGKLGKVNELELSILYLRKGNLRLEELGGEITA